MRKNYFEKIAKYAKKVYNIEEGFKKLKNPTYKTNKVILPFMYNYFTTEN